MRQTDEPISIYAHVQAIREEEEKGDLRVSHYLRSIEEKAAERTRLQTHIGMLLNVLSWRFPGSVSIEATKAIEKQTDRAALDAFFEVAATASTMEEINSALLQLPTR